jgi:UDP:flavonoid glycosyltransferase YjiC (YdhE family)
MLPLALAARRAGHDVVFGTGPDMSDTVAGQGLAVWPVGPTHAAALGDDPPSFRFFTVSADPRTEALLPRAHDWAPDLVIADEFELAGMIVALTSGAELVVHGLGLMIPMDVWSMAEPVIAEVLGRWSLPDGVAAIRDSPYLEAAPRALHLDGERVWSRTSPLQPVPGLARPDEELPAALDDLPYPDTIHLTLGTLFHGRLDVFAAAIAGLRGLEANVVVTTGPGSDPARFGPQPTNVLIEPYIPHALLLPRCQLVVSQGGAGIMFGALRHGLPQLMLPQGADQAWNAAACVRRGAALSIPPEEFTSETVRTAARRLLAESGFGRAAGAIGDEIHAMPDAHTVIADLAAGTRSPG